ncbi:hypothetical protein SAMD00019534_104000 [Acytostelium subglobosum LB1]|uniref:hypothetical protein n=1 Tax=Acytostelium subglobosum LB1 TaxID=1410327 RepID=UPI0006449EFF|nr:hypothetical protein SAMD00019534_104000 [Acytostelium subglobosum LB1]GAM27225.1 hypothetical protein SAMD00019534_104000 [Acytostelium subglobosum LB1]|eukprot:XP_012749692.1 hypothetical protein SAMD00019534_104000 [Acytostelium subglobosum LB1]
MGKVQIRSQYINININIHNTNKDNDDDYNDNVNDNHMYINNDPSLYTTIGSLSSRDFPVSPSLTHLVLDGSVTSLQTLKFGTLFNQPITPGCLPSSITSLKFGDRFNKALSLEAFPSSLTSLEIGTSFDHSLEGVLPSSLRTLVLLTGHCELRPTTLPRSLTSLMVGPTFMQFLVKDVLPPTLISLTFDRDFNMPLLADVLPSSLTHLTLGLHFGSELVLPPSVTHLTIGYFSQFKYVQSTVRMVEISYVIGVHQLNNYPIPKLPVTRLDTLLLHGKCLDDGDLRESATFAKDVAKTIPKVSTICIELDARKSSSSTIIRTIFDSDSCQTVGAWCVTSGKPKTYMRGYYLKLT